MIFPRLFEFIGYINQETFNYLKKGANELWLFESFGINNDLDFGVCDSIAKGKIKMFKNRVYWFKKIKEITN